MKIQDFVPAIVNILERYVLMLPMEACTKVMGLDDICFSVIFQAKRNGINMDFDHLETTLANVSAQMSDSKSKIDSINQQASRDRRLQKLDNEVFPDSFRTHEVVPTCQELLFPGVPPLRRLVINGPYQSSEE